MSFLYENVTIEESLTITPDAQLIIQSVGGLQIENLGVVDVQGRIDTSNTGKIVTTTKGDLITQDLNRTVALAVGLNGQVLSANSASATGLEWIDPTIAGLGFVAGDGLELDNLTVPPTLNISVPEPVGPAATIGIYGTPGDTYIAVRSTGLAGQPLISAGVGQQAVFSPLDLSNTDTTFGVLPVSQGGTGNNLLPINSLLASNITGTAIVGATNPEINGNTYPIGNGEPGQVLISNGANQIVFSDFTVPITGSVVSPSIGQIAVGPPIPTVPGTAYFTESKFIGTDGNNAVSFVVRATSINNGTLIVGIGSVEEFPFGTLASATVIANGTTIQPVVDNGVLAFYNWTVSTTVLQTTSFIP